VLEFKLLEVADNAFLSPVQVGDEAPNQPVYR
jgi:hypothetical protein